MKEEDKEISAYAFNVGRDIEKFINERNDYLTDRNNELEAKILHYSQIIIGEEATEHYKKYFNILSSNG